MGAGQPFGTQFLPHASPRGPTGLSPGGVASVMAPLGVGPTRAPAVGTLYGAQRLPQHTYPGPPPGQQLPRQGVKRAYGGEVSAAAGLRGWDRCCVARAVLTLCPQGYPAQQYLQGGQYPGTQYPPGAPQSSAPSPSYPGHRMQPGVGQYLSAAGGTGAYYKVWEGLRGAGLALRGARG